MTMRNVIHENFLRAKRKFEKRKQREKPAKNRDAPGPIGGGN